MEKRTENLEEKDNTEPDLLTNEEVKKVCAFCIKIVNDRGDEDQLNVLLTAGSSSGLTGIKLGVSTLLPDVSKICADTLVSARLYVGYGTLPATPVSDQYYGWVEFSKGPADSCVWINLSNVDQTGLPLTLEGTTPDGKSWSLGYKNSITKIINQLESIIKPNCGAIIKCKSCQPKIVAPNIKPECYRSYDDYLNTLTKANAKLTIVSDTPEGGQPVTFTGNFLPASGPKDPIISLSGDSHTFVIYKEQFTTEIIYRCDGGTIQFDGKTVPDNDPSKTPQATISNSTFREICIGMNEGYFTPTGENNSAKFPSLKPFQNGRGSQYAEIIHENSNSYGFPYADSNLKVLIQAAPDKVITLTICKDDEAKDYDPSPPRPQPTGV